jgi:hypothetical protein
MDYIISEDKFIRVIDRWMDFEFPNPLGDVTDNFRANSLFYRDETGDIIFKYNYGDEPNAPNKKGLLIVSIHLEEKFTQMFGEKNLPYLGEWFQINTGNPVKKIR